MGGGVGHCFYNEFGYWQCVYWETPLPEIGAPESSIAVVCDELTLNEPTPDNCECIIVLVNVFEDSWGLLPTRVSLARYSKTMIPEMASGRIRGIARTWATGLVPLLVPIHVKPTHA